MSDQSTLLFQVGQLVESRSFIEGFRGAWFRCEIKEVAWNKGQIRYRVRYYDYEDDGLEWLNLYEEPTINQDLKKTKKSLMLRPQFPPVYRENELPDVTAISNVVLVVDGQWSVGDIVDWWKDECYWVATITEVLGDDTVRIKLPDEPVGEGLSYVANYKDLRPSLNWSPNSGWKFPLPVEGQHGHSHARLIRPLKQGVAQSRSDLRTSTREIVFALPARNSKDLVERTKITKAIRPPRPTPRDSISSHTSASSLPVTTRLTRFGSSAKQGKDDILRKNEEQLHEKSAELDTGGSAVGKTSAEIPLPTSADKKDPVNLPAKEIGEGKPILLNSTFCGNMESAILDLEELVCRIKWLKDILKFGRPSKSLHDKWECQEYPTVSKPK